MASGATITDADGKPLPGAQVRAQMKRHAFGWGSAVDARILLGDGPDSERYRRGLQPPLHLDDQLQAGQKLSR